MVFQSIMRAIMKSFQVLVLKVFIARNIYHVNKILLNSRRLGIKTKSLFLSQQHWEAGPTKWGMHHRIVQPLAVDSSEVL